MDLHLHPASSSRRALIRYAFAQWGLVLVLAVTACFLGGPRLLAFGRGDFSHLTYFDLIFYPLFLLGLGNAIYYPLSLIYWGETVDEQSFAVALPTNSKLELKAPESCPLRVQLLLRDSSTLPSLSGSVRIVSAGNEKAVVRKSLSGRQGTYAKVLLLQVPAQANSGNLILEIELDRHARWGDRKSDPPRHHLAFDVIVKAKLPKI